LAVVYVEAAIGLFASPVWEEEDVVASEALVKLFRLNYVVAKVEGLSDPLNHV
jgi:hypothetical protein